MSATAALDDIAAADTSLALVEQPKSPDPADRFAQLVLQLVALAGAPVDPTLITPAAVVLRDEHLIDLPDVTFGCNYELDVRSFELDRGFVRAIDAGWLKWRSGQVRANPYVALPDVDPDASARASELFALKRTDLLRAARHHLLSDEEDRPGRTA